MSKLVQLHPVPFTTFVVKVASRCNLNCSYCYMYNLADRTYRDQPKLMSLATTGLLADRIAAHAVSHRLAARARHTARRGAAASWQAAAG